MLNEDGKPGSLHPMVRRFTDCRDLGNLDGCTDCDVCRYLDFLDYACGCAPAESVITRNPDIDAYLKLSDDDRARTIYERDFVIKVTQH